MSRENLEVGDFHWLAWDNRGIPVRVTSVSETDVEYRERHGEERTNKILREEFQTKFIGDLQRTWWRCPEDAVMETLCIEEPLGVGIQKFRARFHFYMERSRQPSVRVLDLFELFNDYRPIPPPVPGTLWRVYLGPQAHIMKSGFRRVSWNGEEMPLEKFFLKCLPVNFNFWDDLEAWEKYTLGATSIPEKEPDCVWDRLGDDL